MSVRGSPDYGFKVGEPVAAEGRRGTIIAHADDSPMLLVRWAGTHVCDWIKAEDLVHVTEAVGPRSVEGDRCLG